MIVEKGANFGDLKVFTVKVNDKDVSQAVVSAHVFQDILSPTTTAIINMNDTNNLLMNIPIRAGSKITIQIETDLDSAGDGEKTWEFVIYRVGDKELLNSKQQAYSIFAADKAFLLNQTRRIYRSYRNQKTTDIAANVISEYLGGETLVHPSDNSLDLLVPGWTPFYTLSWLLKTSLRNGSADYVIFQDWDGKFCFKSYEELYSSSAEKSGITFDMVPTNLREQGETKKDLTTSINSYTFEHFDAISNLSTGFYKNKVVSYDLISKLWETKTFTFGDDNADDKSAQQLDDDLFLGAEDSNISFVPKHPGMTSSGTYLDNADVWQTSRKSAVQKFEQEKLIISFPGSAKACQWFARNCQVDLPSQDFESDEEYDKQRRGTYLIATMAHMINKDIYTINAELVKKRLEE